MENLEEKPPLNLGDSIANKQSLPANEPTTNRESAVSTVKAQLPLPNGGPTAWLQVLGCFMLYFNTWYVKVTRI